MRRLSQKEHERFFVERAAEYLGKIWTLADCECLDVSEWPLLANLGLDGRTRTTTAFER